VTGGSVWGFALQGLSLGLLVVIGSQRAGSVRWRWNAPE